MTRCIVFLFSISVFANLLSAQETVPWDQFIRTVERQKPASAKIDTVATAPFRSDLAPVSYYFETYQHQGKWFFLTYYEQHERGNQILCQCSYDTLQIYFKGLADNFAADKFGTHQFTYDIDLPNAFYFNNCLNMQEVAPIKIDGPILQKLLSGQLPPLQMPGEAFAAEVEAQMLLRQDGHWILDLEGHLPEDKQLIQVLSPQLYYLWTTDHQYYPGADVAPWKANLVERGRETHQLVGYEQAWKNDLGRHRVLPTAKPKQHWNVQFMMEADEHLPASQLEAAGHINLVISDGTTEILHEPFTYFEAGKRYEFELDDSGTLYISDANPSDGFRSGLAYYPDSHWLKAVFVDQAGDTVAQFTPQQAPTTLDFSPLAGHTYFIYLTRTKQESIKIPFQLSMPGEALHPGFGSDEMYSKRYRFNVKHDGHYRISALYDIYAPQHSGQDSFTLLRAYDNTGKDLLLHQADSIDAYNEWIASLGEDRSWWDRPIEEPWKKGFSWELHAAAKPRDHYHLEIGLWEKPAANASKIFLEGLLHYRSPDGNWASQPWQDTLQLSSAQGGTTAKIEGSEAPAPFLSAYEFQLGDTGTGDEHGIRANYALTTPIGHSYVKMNMQQSQLTALHDNFGKDLLLSPEETEARQYARNKHLTEPQRMDAPFRTLRPNNWSNSYGSPIEQVRFNVYSQLGLSPGADQIQGQATVAYYCAARDDLMVGEQTINYKNQELIRLEVDGHIVQYKRSAFTNDIAGKTYSHYSLDRENLPAWVVATMVLDGDEEINPNPADAQFSLYDLHIPEGLGERPLTIRLLYAEMHQHQEQMDIEVSLHGTIHN